MPLDSERARELQKLSTKSRIHRNPEVLFKGRKPVRSNETDAGFDLRADGDFIIKPKSFEIIPTGTRVCAPPGYFYLVVPRSSMILRGGLIQPGTIDPTYTGELMVPLQNMTDLPIPVCKGERIAQIVFFPVISPAFREVQNFENQEGRGNSGWGSSGK